MLSRGYLEASTAQKVSHHNNLVLVIAAMPTIEGKPENLIL